MGKSKRTIATVCLALLFLAAVTACTSQSRRTSQPSAATSPIHSSATVANNGYDYGYGTYYVATRRYVPPNWGNARNWYAQAKAAGYQVGDVPKKGAIAWTGKGQFGQVAIVENVSADGKQVTISEMDGPGGWNVVTTRTVPANSFKFIY